MVKINPRSFHLSNSLTNNIILISQIYHCFFKISNLFYSNDVTLLVIIASNK